MQTIGPENWARFQVARVISVHRERYSITDGAKDLPAELIGNLKFGAATPEDYPTVGDWVLAQFHDDGAFALIHGIVPRKSLIKRKTSGKTVEFQLIAANIDVAFVIQSMDSNYNIRRLERYLVMVYDSQIQPVVLLSKSDLLTAEEMSFRMADIRAAMPGIGIQPFSNKTGAGLDKVKGLLAPGQTCCLLGSSGVGKTTLINNLLGESFSDTQPVREKDGKGRHTTTRRDLIRLGGGALIVDNPGMREFGILSAEAGLIQAFPEISEWAQQCRFGNCSHVNESGCAVLGAVNRGELTDRRYRNYLKMSKESAYNDMSYLEKRRKDKMFGKLCKSVMKQKKHRR